jgi:hypothetical protein
LTTLDSPRRKRVNSYGVSRKKAGDDSQGSEGRQVLRTYTNERGFTTGVTGAKLTGIQQLTIAWRRVEWKALAGIAVASPREP